MRLTAGLLVLASTFAAAPAGAATRKVDLVMAQGELPDAKVVDVAIDIFAPGVSDAPASPMLQQGIRSSVRKSEARYMPTHLRDTLQSTGQWGEVRVIPGGASWAQLLVTGRIDKSNGKDVALELQARDAAGRVWLDKRYTQRADTTAYAKDRPLDGRDPFQSLYNRVANDLARERDRRSAKELQASRDVAALRFAAEMAPDPYASYLATDSKGRSKLVKLPAADDPMFRRISTILERDRMFVDTLNEFYSDFYARMDRPYDDWRAYSYEEQKALDSINNKSLLKKILGFAAIAGGILLDPTEDNGMKDVLILGGIAAVSSGFEDAKEKGIHKAALSELADSFEGEITPLLVDVDGRVVQLTGSAEVQFTKWRELLHKIGETDEPVPTDINIVPLAPAELVKP
jgi:hypothetical protein